MPLPADLCALVDLAERVTETPPQVGPADVSAAVAGVGSADEYLDAVGVMLGFNFITRVANALGVELDLPRWARRFEAVWQVARGLVVEAVRWLVDLRPRPFRGRSPARNLAALDRLFADVGLPLPAALRRFAAAPHLLEVQRELWEALLRRGGSSGQIVLNVEQFMTAGLVVLDEIGTPYAARVAEWFHARGSDTPQRIRAWAHDGAAADGFDILVARLARDVTRRSWTITPERIGELRAAGLDDADVLDLVSGIALWNALGRLEVLLAGLPDSSGTATPPPQALSTCDRTTAAPRSRSVSAMAR